MPNDTAAGEAAREPNLFRQHHERAIALFKQDRFGDAVPAFRLALEVRRDPGALHNLGAAYAKLGKLEDAVACFREAVGAAPDGVGGHKNLGAALQELGRLDEAAGPLA